MVKPELSDIMQKYYFRQICSKLQEADKYFDMMECAGFDSWCPSIHSGKRIFKVGFVSSYKPLEISKTG